MSADKELIAWDAANVALRGYNIDVDVTINIDYEIAATLSALAGGFNTRVKTIITSPSSHIKHLQYTRERIPFDPTVNPAPGKIQVCQGLFDCAKCGPSGSTQGSFARSAIAFMTRDEIPLNPVDRAWDAVFPHILKAGHSDKSVNVTHTIIYTPLNGNPVTTITTPQTILYQPGAVGSAYGGGSACQFTPVSTGFQTAWYLEDTPDYLHGPTATGDDGAAWETNLPFSNLLAISGPIIDAYTLKTVSGGDVDFGITHTDTISQQAAAGHTITRTADQSIFDVTITVYS